MLRDEWTTYSNWCALHFLEHHRVLPCSPPALSPTPGTAPATFPCLTRTAGVGRAGGQVPAPLSCLGQTGMCPTSVCLLFRARSPASTGTSSHPSIALSPSTASPPRQALAAHPYLPAGGADAGTGSWGEGKSSLSWPAGLGAEERSASRGKGRQPPPCRGAAGPQAVGAIVMQ